MRAILALMSECSLCTTLLAARRAKSKNERPCVVCSHFFSVAHFDSIQYGLPSFLAALEGKNEWTDIIMERKYEYSVLLWNETYSGTRSLFNSKYPPATTDCRYHASTLYTRKDHWCVCVCECHNGKTVNAVKWARRWNMDKFHMNCCRAPVFSPSRAIRYL